MLNETMLTSFSSGVTGAAGNLGGIVFALIFRFVTITTVTKGVATTGSNYGKAMIIIGAITIGLNLAVSWIRPIPKRQIGGH